jgi:hypothetical protein
MRGQSAGANTDSAAGAIKHCYPVRIGVPVLQKLNASVPAMIALSMRLSKLIPGAVLALHVAAAPAVDFARDVRPILSDRCFVCHGPDEGTRKAGLRLDTQDGAKKARGPHTPVIPGDIAGSEILKRVAPANPAIRMPPPYSDRKPLSDKEVATLRAWIEQGAKWQGHWSFTAPVRPAEPAVRQQT